MKYPMHELIDRASILQVKAEHEPENSRLQMRINAMKAEILDAAAFDALRDINRQIWELESDVRRGKELSYEEVGRRAISIRELNQQRCDIKAGIAINSGEFYP